MRVRLPRGVLFKRGANVKYLSFRRKRLAGGATNGAYTDPAAGLQTKSMKLSSGKQSVATAAAREFVAIPAFSGLMELVQRNARGIFCSFVVITCFSTLS